MATKKKKINRTYHRRSSEDSYLLEHTGIIKIANKIIVHAIKHSKFQRISRGEVVNKLMMTPGFARRFRFKNWRLANLLSLAAHRGAFESIKLNRKGFSQVVDADALSVKQMQHDVNASIEALFDAIKQDIFSNHTQKKSLKR